MEAIEFKAKVENGVIHIPQKYRQTLSSSVKVIILSDPFENESDESDEINALLRNPITIKSFTPLARKEIYKRD